MSPSITTATQIYRQNAVRFPKGIEGLNAEEWLRRPCPSSNPILWIVGHLVWSRARALHFLGVEWSRPWLPMFARGAALHDDAQHTSPEEIVAGWQDVSAALATALEAAPDAILSAPAPEKSPSLDGSIGGLVSFLAFHEAYHMGQVIYLRRWLGHASFTG